MILHRNRRWKMCIRDRVGMDSLQAKQILEGILKLEKMDSCKPLENRQLELKRIWLNKLVSVLEEHMENTELNVAMPVSYTHLDVYKRQVQTSH